eukprot:1182312-Prorocentrum_minimum.AAC.4
MVRYGWECSPLSAWLGLADSVACGSSSLSSGAPCWTRLPARHVHADPLAGTESKCAVEARNNEGALHAFNQ